MPQKMKSEDEPHLAAACSTSSRFETVLSGRYLRALLGRGGIIIEVSRGKKREGTRIIARRASFEEVREPTMGGPRHVSDNVGCSVTLQYNVVTRCGASTRCTYQRPVAD